MRNRHAQRRYQNNNNNHRQRSDKRTVKQSAEEVFFEKTANKIFFILFRLFQILFNNLIFGVSVYELNLHMNLIMRKEIIIDARSIIN